MAEKSFRCTVITPNKQVLDQDVTAAVIPAWDGEIGLLKQRAPLMVKLGHGTMRLDGTGGGPDRLYIGGGFAQMKGDQLTLLTEEAQPVGEINIEEAQAALREAEAFKPQDAAQTERRQRDLQRAKALLKAAGH
jgi:F-type H+-transporting ATPase subunit epsilon